MKISLNEILCLLEEMESIKGKYRRRKKYQAKLKELCQEWWNYLITKYSLSTCCSQLHLIFKCLVPELDKRRKFGMLEKKLTSYFLDIFGLKGTNRGQVIENWKGNDQIATYFQGDLGGRIYHIMASDNAVTNSRCLSLLTMQNLLNELAWLCPWTTLENYGNLEPRNALNILSDLYIGQSSLSMKWITRFILKNMGPKMPPDPLEIL